MADYTFQERARKDSAFALAIEGVAQEAILRSAGVDPELLNKAWEAGVRPLTLTNYEKFADAMTKSAKRGRKSSTKKSEAETEDTDQTEE